MVAACDGDRPPHRLSAVHHPHLADRSHAGHDDSPRCPRCDGAHLVDRTGTPEYVYLLGVHLGDGCISAHARSVFRLRITLDSRYPGLIEECRAALSTVARTTRSESQLRSGGYETSVPDSNVVLSVYSK